MLFLKLCISRMSVMMKMQSIGLTILSLLAMRNASYLSEWAKGERGIGKPRDGKRASNQRPTKTLFVINFDPILTKEGDIDMHFEPYGKVRIRHNFAFVQFATQEDAIKALESTPKLVTRVQLLMEPVSPVQRGRG
ncbi:unnamed protein product [Brassica rapa]|uniref:RRM domain-containing protein n=2 Tax=Brassica campestris TaxID=3711 RepID=A0A8D9GIN4_BRACM|nr:unnamed protein product [Brassica rapa]